MSIDNKESAQHSSTTKDVDILRDTKLRLLGYANEVGEAFRAQISKWSVRATYGVASFYVIADAIDKGYKASKTPNGDPPSNTDRNRRALIAVGDTLVWQSLASVAIPGATINRICWASTRIFSLLLLRTGRSVPGAVLPPAAQWLVTGLGLATIPFIVHPIDGLVDWGMNRFARPHYHVSPRVLDSVVRHQRED